MYALDIVLEADPKMNKKRLLKIIEGRVVSQACLMGYYSKKAPSRRR